VGLRVFVRRVSAAAAVCGLAGAAAFAFDGRPVHRHMLTDPQLDAALVIDARTGGVLYTRNAEAPRHPASLTKMMTLYLLFERLRQGRIALDTPISVSANAAEQPRSRLGLHEGNAIPVETAIKAIVVCSANDAAVAVAETLGGTELHFSELMNAKAHQLGMAHTFFHNATGLPDDLQQTTADDLSILARHLVYDYPEYFPYFRTKEMTWRGEDFATHNALIGNYAGADGIKTGYIDASGYNLVGTAERGKTRLIAIVMGGLTAERRDTATMELLDATFDGLAAGTLRLPAVAASAPPRAVTIPPRTDTRSNDDTAMMIAAAALVVAPGIGLLLASAAASV